MKAVIPAAGRGTRLRPLTDKRPKQMLLVAGKPLIGHTIDNFRNINIDELLLVIGATGRSIRNYVNGLSLPFHVDYVEQFEPKGTGHATSLAGERIDSDPFLLVNGDVIPSSNLLMRILELYEEHNSSLLIASRVDNPEIFGIVKTKNELLNEIIEKPLDVKPVRGLINVGVYIITPEILEAIEEVEVSSRGEIELTDALNIVAARSEVRVLEAPRDEWIHVSYPWDLLKANMILLGNARQSIQGEVEEHVKLKGPIVLCKGSIVKAGSTIEGPAFIGDGSEVGPNSYIRRFTCLHSCVKVGNACEIKNSIVMARTKIPHLSYVGDSIIGANCNLGAGTVTANLRFDGSIIKTTIEGRLVSTGERKFGAVLGDNVRTGVNVSLMPGVKVGESACIDPNICVYRDVPSGVYVTSRRKLAFTDLPGSAAIEQVESREMEVD